MTLQDLWLVIKHYSKWVILVPVICAVLAGGAGALLGVVNGAVYTASSTLTVIDPTGLTNSSSIINLINVFAQDQSKIEGISDKDAIIETSVDPSSQSVRFKVKTPDEQKSVDLANLLADKTADAAKSALDDHSDAYVEAMGEISAPSLSEEEARISADAITEERIAALRSCFFVVSPSMSAEKASAMSYVAKYAAMAFLAGLFLVVCVLVLVDSAKRPLKCKRDVEAASKLPVWTIADVSQSGERLWANIQFAARNSLESVCILPVSGGKRSDVERTLLGAMREAGLGDAIGKDPRVMACDSLENSIVGVRVAKVSSVTIVAAVRWRDTAPALCDVLEELRLASANVVGIILLSGEGRCDS